MKARLKYIFRKCAAWAGGAIIVVLIMLWFQPVVPLIASLATAALLVCAGLLIFILMMWVHFGPCGRERARDWIGYIILGIALMIGGVITYYYRLKRKLFPPHQINPF